MSQENPSIHSKKRTLPAQKNNNVKRRRKDITLLDEKLCRLNTFHKRREGIFKKAYELAKLTGCEIFLFMASETGQVYVFSTDKMRQLVTNQESLEFFEQCLNLQTSRDE
jgi:pheromone receptor transcription factor